MIDINVNKCLFCIVAKENRIMESRLFLTVFLFVVALLPFPVHGSWLPFSLENGHIIIEVKIGDQEAKAILDSGAMSNLISKSFVRKHGQNFTTSGKSVSQGVNSTQKLQLYSNIPISLYGTDLVLDKVAAIWLSGADIILGSGFFRSGILQIDYPNSRLRFLHKKSVNLKKQANISMKPASDSPLPAIEVLLKGKKAWLLFDTGSNGGLALKRSFALDRGLIGEDTNSDQIIVKGINNIGSYEKFKLDSVKIGPYELENVSTSVPSEGQASNLGSGFNTRSGTRLQRGVKTSGLLGYDVLKHFLITVDYEKYQMHIYAE